MTSDEMPHDEIVTVPVKGLFVGGDRNVFCEEEGFITFVRGNHEEDDVEVNDDSTEEENDKTYRSKESRVARLHRELVYYPFIEKIRKSRYDMQGDDVPDDLRVVSWSDGANAQIKHITNEETLKKDEDLKITNCKHSAARTAVEQAADATPVFKMVKSIVKSMNASHHNTNHVLHNIDIVLCKLENGEMGPEKIVRLKNHKKKAIRSTVSNLPEATGNAYTTRNVQEGFIFNGQIDSASRSVPLLDSIINTYRGDIANTCLADRKKLIRTYFREMYVNGEILETTFDSTGIPKDRDSRGAVIERHNEIQLENRHRAKILSSNHQIRKRRHLIDVAAVKAYKSKYSLYQSEKKDVEMNLECEKKLLKIMSIMTDRHVDSCHISDVLTMSMIQSPKHNIKLLKDEVRAFVRVRSPRHVRACKIVYSTVVEQRKADLMARCIDDRIKPYSERLFVGPPTPPNLLELDMIDITLD